MILRVDFSENNAEFDGDFAGFIGDMGTKNYNELENKPKINGVTIEGDKTAEDLGLQSEIDDLDDIRDGAAAGATALQPAALNPYRTASAQDVIDGGKQPKHKTASATLTTAGWSSKSQTVSVIGVTANNTVIVSPASASADAWAQAKVYCSAQGAGTLTFVCEQTPTAALTANIVIFD